MKGEALLSNLELAGKFLAADNISRSMAHLQGAQKALTKLIESRTEYVFTKKGWDYVLGMTEELRSVTELVGLKDMVSCCEFIIEHAKQLRDSAPDSPT